jgi:hypothetical protein
VLIVDAVLLLLLQGKVRDTYELDDKLVIVTTDRQSAFDRLLASIPFKGQVREAGHVNRWSPCLQLALLSISGLLAVSCAVRQAAGFRPL